MRKKEVETASLDRYIENKLDKAIVIRSKDDEIHHDYQTSLIELWNENRLRGAVYMSTPNGHHQN